MTQQNEFFNLEIDSARLAKRMLQGAAIGLILITLFLFSVDEYKPEWGKLWMAKPLIIVPLAGAMGGLCHYLLMRFYKQVGINKILAIIVSAIVFVVGLFLGTVLGLDGTLWN